jgi:HSP20 family protein
MALYGFPHPARSDLFTMLDRMRREMDAFLPGAGAHLGAGPGNVYPPVNLYETGEDFVLMAELPGVRREDLDLTIEANRITLRGERQIVYPEEEGTSVHRRERQTGIFRRTFEFPVPVDSDKAEALYRDGILRVRLPKAASHRPRQITVQAS